MTAMLVFGLDTLRMMIFITNYSLSAPDRIPTELLTRRE